MKNFYFLFTLAATVFFAAACTDDLSNDKFNASQKEVKVAQLTDDEAKVLFQMRNPDNKVSLDEAMRLAYDVIGFLDGETATKYNNLNKL
jgi:hypothetical protein